jgi:hypothetical protein
MYVLAPSIELHRQIAPPTARAPDPQRSFGQPEIVESRSTMGAFIARQASLDFLPYFVAQWRSDHPASLAQKTGCKHISASSNRP